MMEEKMTTTVTYSIPNIHCNHCVHTVTMEVSELQGVQSVVADLESRQATVVFEPPATETAIKDILAEINYPVAE
jgi:copper chaperone